MTSEAYEPAEKPLEEWTEAAIEKEIEAMTGESEEKVKAVLKPYSLSDLQTSLIVPCPWSHGSSYIVRDLEALDAIEDWLFDTQDADYLGRAVKEMGEYLRLEAKYEGKMPLDKDALKAMREYAEERSSEDYDYDTAEGMGFSWLFDKYGSEKAISEHEDEIDALAWVPFDRLRMLRILNLPDDED